MTEPLACESVGVSVAAEQPRGLPDDWEGRHVALAVRWTAVAALERLHVDSALTSWRSRLDELQTAHSDLVNRGLWRGGPRTLLAAIGVQYRELALTAGLAWLLRPDGQHRLGAGMLRGLLRHVEINELGQAALVRVVLEEQRNDTRADLVIYGPDWTVVVEAKTFAPEQPRQLDRLYTNWKDEVGARFIYLSRGRREPLSAEKSRASWRPLTWNRVAELARQASAGVGGAAPGVNEYIATLEGYHHV